MKTHPSEKRVLTVTPFIRQWIRTPITAATIAFLLSGCFGGQPGRMTEQYAFDYAPALQQGFATLPETITVERFGAAQLYNSTAMVYQDAPGQRNQYLYHRWRVNPADLVSDYLLRDLRSANLFRGVFHHRGDGSGRYLLAGDIEEFLEHIDKEDHRAIVSLNATLFDTARPGLSDRILFQKDYRIAEPFDEQSPAGMAKGMSRAVAQISGLLLNDIFKAVQATRMLKQGDQHE
ncbi:MAG: membrane integrity-associated transporter subunit PqiC [Steroidobacteraceae bacterium]|nr:membrane integrity-associated transporter subunit PqiC [Deltaproteobacteria bacterium]